MASPHWRSLPLTKIIIAKKKYIQHPAIALPTVMKVALDTKQYGYINFLARQKIESLVTSLGES